MTAATPPILKPTTLYFDSEKSGESYIHLYADEPGVQGPLWPAPIPVIGVSGKIGQGKTTFLLDIAAGPVYRIDLPLQMMKFVQANPQKFPSGTYKPADTFEWFWSMVRTIPPGKFRVIALDVAEEIEAGVAEWVWNNPTQFGKSRDQFIKMSGIYQGIVSSFWKSILMDLTSRCETFAFANHTGQAFGSDGKAIAGREKQKGRPVMKQSATLYVNLTREKDAAGNLKMVPAGVVDLSEGGKTRLMTKVIRNGAKLKVPVLPPRMPVATPQAIRDYFVTPPDYSALIPSQLTPERTMTADERIAAQTELVQSETTLERLRIERLAEERRAAGGGDAAAPPIDFDDQPVAEVFNPPAPETETPASIPEIADSPAAPLPITPEFESSPTPTPAPAPATVAIAFPVPDAAPVHDSVAVTPGADNVVPPGAVSAAGDAPPDSAPAAKAVRGLKGSVMGYLHQQTHPVRAEVLFAAMHECVGKDSASVNTAVKALRGDGMVKVVQVGDLVLIGLPAAVPGVPAASSQAAVQPTSPSPASAPSAPSAPPPSATPLGYVRPACLPRDPLDAVNQCWQEFVILNGWTQTEGDTFWKEAVLDRYGAFTGKELTAVQLAEIERRLVTKINAHYAANNPAANPFRTEMAT